MTMVLYGDFGGAGVTRRCLGEDGWFAVADGGAARAMYVAKQTGKNRVGGFLVDCGGPNCGFL